MKIRLILSCLALALVAAPLVRAQDATPPPAAAPAEKADKTDLEKQMDIVAKSFRKLKKQVSDATQNDDSAALVAKMIDATKASADLVPAKADSLSGDDKTKFIADYKTGIQGMVDKLTALQALIKAGKNDEAAAAVADLGKYETKEHKEFRKEKPKA